MIFAVEVVTFLRDNGCYHIGEAEAFNLVKYFDSDGDMRLRFNDFAQIFLPCEDNMLRNIVLQRPAKRVGPMEFMPKDLEMAMTAVLEKEIGLMRKLAVLKRELVSQYDYAAMAAYRSIDKNASGRVDTVILGNFLRGQGHFSDEMMLLAVIRRIDTDGDALITFDELAEFLRPEDPPTGHAYGPSLDNVVYGARGGSPMRARSPNRLSFDGPPPPREVRIAANAPYEQMVSAPMFTSLSQPVPRKPILAPWNEEQ